MPIAPPCRLRAKPRRVSRWRQANTSAAMAARATPSRRNSMGKVNQPSSAAYLSKAATPANNTSMPTLTGTLPSVNQSLIQLKTSLPGSARPSATGAMDTGCSGPDHAGGGAGGGGGSGGAGSKSAAGPGTAASMLAGTGGVVAGTGAIVAPPRKSSVASPVARCSLRAMPARDCARSRVASRVSLSRRRLARSPSRHSR